MNIAVAGTGYVGLSLAVLLAQHNHVTAVDIIPEKIEKLNNYISPIQDEYIEKYFATYPGVKSFLDELVKNAKEKGYVTTMYGRKRPVPELKSGNFMQRQFGERVAMNAPIQGTAADIMKMAMINVERELKNNGLKSQVLLQVHDELLVEVPEEEKEITVDIIRKEMTRVIDLPVSLEVDINIGCNWYETH